MLFDIITSNGSLSDMEASLNQLGLQVTPSLISHTIHSCHTTTTTTPNTNTSRRLLRFFSWCRRNTHQQQLGDDSFNHLIRALTQMKDITAMNMAISDFHKDGGKMDPETFVSAAEALVRSGKPSQAIRLFRVMEEASGCSSIVPIVHALCEKGHVRVAQCISWRRRDKLVDVEQGIIHRSLLHGWCVHGNAGEARKVLDEMKSMHIHPGVASYHDFLRCICKRNLKFNPSALVLEAANVMIEMRRSGVHPTAVSFNILLSCLGRARRVKEACRILDSMMRGEEGIACSADCVSYYLVARVLYLTRRFIRGHRVVDWMSEEGGMGIERLYHDLIGILCGMDVVGHAIKVFDRMKMYQGQNIGPTYDLLIGKLCRSGKFEIGRSLWDEAVEKGIGLQCSKDLLDPSKTEVFKPIKASEKMKRDHHNWVVKKRKRVAATKKRKAGTVGRKHPNR